ncbi:ArsC/Spx/MgsR family protein [Lactococcus allomyrinae]|uniref:Spx/MgsR family RNA polymerase-binding regulatory protein n=1 Tax=Lactococcus allomyrinae TaxID=2419773 RepID=A0A387BGR6_9LACT|nr:ArsC/Spx/MgsR family protein [Lactococcus allomyrinae]AYG00207.1 hypothetical protein D7I46_03360 [Lactococcus allomyrinae]
MSDEVIKVYYSVGRKSATVRKLEKWFQMHQMEYQLLTFGSLTQKELLNILYLTDQGFSDIIRSKIKNPSLNKLLNQAIDKYTVPEMLDFLLEHHYLLKSPIAIKDHKLQIGYNEEELRQFIHRERRIVEQRYHFSQ